MQEQRDEPGATNVSAAEWRELRLALTQRLRDLVEARSKSADDPERAQLQQKIDATRKQVATLELEEAVAQFVEDSERYVEAVSTVGEELNRDPDSEIA